MNTLLTVWLPAGQDLSDEQQEALAVPARVKPDRSMYPDLLASSLQAQVNSDLKEASWAMEMLLSQVATQNNQKVWGLAIAKSDELMMVLNRIDWSLPGSIKQIETQNLSQRLEILV